MVMRSFYILSFLICLSVWGACKHEAPAQQEPIRAVDADDTINPPRMESTNSGPRDQSTTSTKPAEGASNGTPQVGTDMGHDYTFLTFKMFKINGAFVPGKDPKEQPYKDQWVDLEPNGTFRWGKGKEVTFIGNWGYNHDLGILGLQPKDKNQKQTEWEVIYNDDMVVLTGTKAFENHGTQLQLIRISQMD